MYKIYRNSFLLIAIVALTFQSCSKEELIELVPEFSLDSYKNPSSMDQVEQVLLGAYTQLRNGNYYGSGSGTGGGWAMMPDVLSDNLYEAVESLANSRTMADWLYDDLTSQVKSFFVVPYDVIASANIVLSNIDNFTTPDNQKRANRIKGQAYALRALAHFDLFRYFAESYDRNSTSSYAVPYVVEYRVSVDVKPARETNKDFYDKLFADLTEAVNLLKDVDKEINTAQHTRPFIDLQGAYAIQARAYLYASMWPEAETAATNALVGRPLVDLNQAAYSGMYNETNIGEIIWNVQFESGQGGPTFLVYFATNQRSYFRPSATIATVDGNSGLIQDNDIRYDAFFQPIGGRLAVTKYKGKGGLSDGNANFVVFKSGEMYLIRAEARARNNMEDLANDDLNALRSKRIAGYSDVILTGASLLNAIADERRRELVAEGHRFFDLKRTSKTINRGPECGDPALSVAGDCTLASSDREWTLPIPNAETNINPNIGQNTGY